MKLYFIIFELITIINCIKKYSKLKIKKNYTDEIDINNGFYTIKSLLNKNYFLINKNILTLSDKNSIFKIIKIKEYSYFIENRKYNKIIAVDGNNNIQLYEKNYNINILKKIWNIIKINENQYLIKNKYINKYIEISNNLSISLNNFNYNKILNKSFLFNFVKLYELGNIKNYHLKLLYKEPIDIIIKYIDTTDKKLNRTGINYIYKDDDNEELRYAIRSILKNISWIRKIFILMPNEKVRFFKSEDEINDKIIYIKDKDLLGYDSSNNCAFSFNLHKMELFGISKNFIYMDDDYFFGKPLKKSDFFYYDEEEKKIYPYILTSKFMEMNKTNVLEEYYKMFEIKDTINPHSGKGFTLSILCTEKFFIDNFNSTLIKTEYTHNAIGQNIDELKEIFELIKKYEYINEMLQSKERYILRLSQQHCFNLFQLNIKHKKVHSLSYKYFKMESINKYKLDIPLFVINTGGNHIPLNRQYKIQKKIMEKTFPYPNIYEIHIPKKQYNHHNISYKLYTIYMNIIFIFIKFFLKLNSSYSLII